MNPIIVAIDAGHIDHGGKCVKCSGGMAAISEHVLRGGGTLVEYPCADILKARRDNLTYLPPVPDTQAPIEPHKDHL